MLHLFEREALSGPPPHPVLVLLHGYGANEEDLSWLANEVDPRVHVILPRAPEIVPGFDGYQWYSPSAVGQPDRAGLEHSLQELSATLELVVRQDSLDASRLILGGFSQGGLMTAAYGARGSRPAPRALVVLSGYLPPDEAIAPMHGLPVFVGHGQDDPVVPVSWGLGLARRLELAGAAVETHTYPGGHGLHPTELAELTRFLRIHL